MNTDVMILREVVTKVTQLLAGKGLEVTQRGTQAKVTTCARTLKPTSVNIPYIPDNATKELILAIQGFIDHEVAHVLFTDWAVTLKATKMKGHFHQLWNLCEDPFIERMMMRRFSGSGYNMERLHEFFIAEITMPALKQAMADENWMHAFSVLMVPYARAWSGQRQFQEFVKAGDYLNHPQIGPMLRRIEPLADEFPKITSSQGSLDLAIKLDAALKPPPAPPAPPPPPAPAPPEEKPPEEKPPENEPQGENGGEGETPEDEGKGAGNEDAPEDDADESDAKGEAGEEGDEKEQDEDADTEGDAAGGAEAPEDDGADDEDDAGDQGDGASDAGDQADEDSDADGEDDGAGSSEDAGGDEEGDQDGDEGEVGGSGAEGDDEDDRDDDGAGKASGEGSDADAGDDEGAEGDAGEDRSDDVDDAGEPDNGNGSSAGAAEDVAEALNPGDEDDRGSGNEEPNASGVTIIVSPNLDFDSLAAERIGKEARDMTARAPYRIYTKDFDVIESFPVNKDTYEDAWLTALDERTRQSVGVMQKEIQRMMAARSMSVNVPGFRSGRLHTSGLHRLAAGDDRVFRRKHENVSKDTAIELLIDNSGSMDGLKMHTAMEAAYALSMTLERVGIQHEVMGFTTHWQDYRKIQEAQAAGAAAGIRYSRTEPLYMPIFKGYDERLTSEVKRRFAAAPFSDFMGANVDGESVEIAARRLMLRKETRKVLMVMSDGNPVSDGCSVGLRQHLKDTVADISKRGIEVIGLGICTDAPKHYYPKFALLKNAAELPKTVMGEVKRILLS